MDLNQVYNITYDLVDEIKSRETYLNYKKYMDLVSNDSELLNQIEKFQEAKRLYQNKKQIELKEKIFNNENYLKFLQFEKELQQILDNISKEIATSVSNRIKYPNELGFIGGCK